MSLLCDNYAKCNGAILVDVTDDRARAAGWHLWSGKTMGGREATVKLCPSCVGQNRRPDAHLPKLMPGDQTMIQFEVEVE